MSFISTSQMNQASIIVTISCHNSGVKYSHTDFVFFLFTVPADPPANFNATAINSTAIQLTWSPPPTPYGIVISYNITYNLSEMINTGSGSGNDFLFLNSVLVNAEDGNSYVVTGLNEYTVYEFEIFASTRIGPGPSTQTAARTHHTSMSAITHLTLTFYQFHVASTLYSYYCYIVILNWEFKFSSCIVSYSTLR